MLQDNGMQITDLKYLHINNAIKVFDHLIMLFSGLNLKAKKEKKAIRNIASDKQS